MTRWKLRQILAKGLAKLNKKLVPGKCNKKSWRGNAWYRRSKQRQSKREGLVERELAVWSWRVSVLGRK
jgi:hypothetical protein